MIPNPLGHSMCGVGAGKLPVASLLVVLLILARSTLACAENEKPLLFLGNKNIAPVVYLEGGTPAGVAVDIVRAMAGHLPRPVEIRAMDWLEAQDLVARGAADALIQINETEERRKKYDFSEPLLESQFSIFTRIDRMGISGISSLGGLRVGVEVAGLPRDLLKNKKDIILTVIPNFTEGLKLVDSRTIDAVVVDYRVGSYLIARDRLRNIKVAGEPVAFSYSSLAVKKGNAELLAAINDALRIIRKDGSYDSIIEKWRPKEVVFQTREQMLRRLYSVALVALLVLFGIAVVWSATLRKELARRKSAEERVAAQFFTVQSIINSTNAVIFSVDREYRYTNFNHAHAAVMRMLYGADIREGESILDYMSIPADREEARRNLDQALAGESLVQEAFSGEELRSRQYFQVSHSPIKSGDQVIGVAVLAQDLTERKRAEETVAQSEALYRALFEDSPTSLWHEDFSEVKARIDRLAASGVENFAAYFEAHPEEVRACAEQVRIIAVNQATLTLFRAKSRQMLMEGLPSIFNQDSLRIFSEELVTLAGGHHEFQSEAVQRRLDGEGFFSVVRVAIAPGYEKNWERVFVSVADITDRKRAEEELRTLNDLLEERVRERTAELENKNDELAKMNRLFVGRELRMVELKERIKALESVE